MSLGACNSSSRQGIEQQRRHFGSIFFTVKVDKDDMLKVAGVNSWPLALCDRSECL